MPVNTSAAHTGSAHVVQEGWCFFPAGCHCQAESPHVACGAGNLVIPMAEGLQLPGCVISWVIPLDSPGGSTSGNFLQPSQSGWVRAKPWGLWGVPERLIPH